MAYTLPDGVFKVKTSSGYEYYQQEDNKLTYITPSDAKARFGSNDSIAYVNENAPNTDPNQLISQFGITGLSNLPQNTELAQAGADYAKAESQGGFTNKQPTPPSQPTGTPPGGGTGAGTAGGSSSGSTTGQQIYRDNNNNFFSVDAQGNKTPISLAQFKQLGLNETFVKPGQTVSLGQAQTGQVGGSGGSGGGAGGTSSWADQNAVDSLKYLFGWSDDQAKQFIATNPDAQNFALMAEYEKRKADLGQAQDKNTLANLAATYDQAVKELADPNSILGSKYADLDKVNVANFQQNLQNLQLATSTEQQQRQIQFQRQQEQQANAAASAGQAYSGFRQRAKQELGSEQSGIVKSSMADIKQKLTSQFQPLEQFYGSKQFGNLFGNAGVNFTDPLSGQTSQLSYNPIGNLTGTEKAQQEADKLARQQELLGIGGSGTFPGALK